MICRHPMPESKEALDVCNNKIKIDFKILNKKI
jgi:hypothetical protein